MKALAINVQIIIHLKTNGKKVTDSESQTLLSLYAMEEIQYDFDENYITSAFLLAVWMQTEKRSWNMCTPRG